MTLLETILSILEPRVGRKRRISRKKLRNWLCYQLQREVSDREMRSAIEELRRSNSKGALICSSSGLSGYWMAEDYDELVENYRHERRRALSLMYTMRQRLRTGRRFFSGQMRML